MGTRVSRRKSAQSRGSLIVFMALAMVAIFMLASLSIDISRYYQQQRDIQSATDAAALSGVLLLTNSPQVASDIINAATVVAQANGLATNDLGTIEVGQWNTNTLTFTAGSKPYTAVRVPAQRSMSLSFGKLVGMNQMVPWAHSVAMLTSAGSAFGGGGAGIIPFGVGQAQATNAFYSQYQICKGDVGTSGNFGQLDLGGGSWANNMLNGCECTVSVGDGLNTITGQNGCCANCTAKGFENRMNFGNPYAVLPVIGTWPSGSSGNASVVGFIGVKIDDVSNCGGNWCITFENVPLELGGGGGITTNAPYSLARVLVQ
jgi:hypothetical protein